MCFFYFVFCNSVLIIEFGGNTSATKQASKGAPRQYSLRRNASIRSHSYQVNNILILTKKFNNVSLEDIYIPRYFEEMMMSKPINMGVSPLNSWNP